VFIIHIPCIEDAERLHEHGSIRDSLDRNVTTNSMKKDQESIMEMIVRTKIQEAILVRHPKRIPIDYLTEKEMDYRVWPWIFLDIMRLL